MSQSASLLQESSTTLTSSFWNVLTGAVCMGFIALLTYSRFSVPQNQKRAHKINDPSLGLSPTIRSYTTRNRYATYAMCYIALWFVIFFALARNSALRSVLSIKLQTGVDNVLAFGALAICIVIPATPVLQRVEFIIRRILYRCARIPSAWSSLVHRILQAPYAPPTDTRKQAEKNITLEGLAPSLFDWTTKPRQIDAPNTPGATFVDDYSTPARVAMLDAQIMSLRSDMTDEHIFDSLRIGENNAIEANAVHDHFIAAIRSALRQPFTAADGTVILSTELKQDFEQLHKEQAGLLARWSLVKHVTDRERVDVLRGHGLGVNEDVELPIPSINDILIISLILSLVLVAPLATFMPPLRAIVILAIVVWSSACPLYLGRAFPTLRLKEFKGRYNICFPVLASAMAAFVALSLSFLSRSVVDETGSLAVDFRRGWELIWSRSWPYSVLAAYVAVTCAVFIQFNPADRGPPTVHQRNRFKILVSIGSIPITLFVCYILWKIDALKNDGASRLAIRIVVPPITCAVIACAFPYWYSAELGRARALAKSTEPPGPPVARSSQ